MNRNSLIIKVCGMRNGYNIRAVEALGVDWMGFIFYASSKRFIDVPPAYLPVNAKRVGVFVNENIETILERVASFRLDIVQLHGDESPALCKQLIQNDIQVVKAFGIIDYLPSEKIAVYEGFCNYFLFDTQTPTHGGSGKHYEWDILQSYQGKTSFLLSGGIGPDDVQKIRDYSHPMCIGIDINSKFEFSPSNKDIQSIQQFIKSLKQ